MCCHFTNYTNAYSYYTYIHLYIYIYIYIYAFVCMYNVCIHVCINICMIKIYINQMHQLSHGVGCSSNNRKTCEMREIFVILHEAVGRSISVIQRCVVYRPETVFQESYVRKFMTSIFNIESQSRVIRQIGLNLILCHEGKHVKY